MLRRPLIQTLELPLPRLPAELEGVRIAHITDLHVRRTTARHRRLMRELAQTPIDLACYTGDYMTRPGDEGAAEQVMRRVMDAASPRLGGFGVFGNHDTAEMVCSLAGRSMRWLINDAVQLETLPIQVWGLSRERYRAFDAAAMAARIAALDRPEEDGLASTPFRLMLSHHPHTLIHAADLDADLMLAGHSHGGQCRLPGGWALANSSRLPRHLTAGRWRYRGTEALVSRGLGEVHLPLRLFCPAHVPIYVLRRDETTAAPSPSGNRGIQSVWSW